MLCRTTWLVRASALPVQLAVWCLFEFTRRLKVIARVDTGQAGQWDTVDDELSDSTETRFYDTETSPQPATTVHSQTFIIIIIIILLMMMRTINAVSVSIGSLLFSYHNIWHFMITCIYYKNMCKMNSSIWCKVKFKFNNNKSYVSNNCRVLHD